MAGLVSVREGTWTTDRPTAADWWGRAHPAQRAALQQLLAWGDGAATVTAPEVERALDRDVALITDQFTARIGAWPD